MYKCLKMTPQLWQAAQSTKNIRRLQPFQPFCLEVRAQLIQIRWNIYRYGQIAKYAEYRVARNRHPSFVYLGSRCHLVALFFSTWVYFWSKRAKWLTWPKLRTLVWPPAIICLGQILSLWWRIGAGETVSRWQRLVLRLVWNGHTWVIVHSSIFRNFEQTLHELTNCPIFTNLHYPLKRAWRGATVACLLVAWRLLSCTYRTNLATFNRLHKTWCRWCSTQAPKVRERKSESNVEQSRLHNFVPKVLYLNFGAVAAADVLGRRYPLAKLLSCCGKRIRIWD